MNFISLQRACFRYLGLADETLLKNFQRQQVRDDLNLTLDEMVNTMPYAWHLVRESSFSKVSGTQTYTLADDVRLPLSFWTEDAKARKIQFVGPTELDRNGLKNPSATLVNALTLTWYPPTTTASKSGASGATAGVSVTEGTTTLTKSGGTAWASTDEGQLIRLNGEDVDYYVTTVNSANSLTLSRNYAARLSGTSTAGTGSGLTQASWEISPVGRYRIQIRPEGTSSETIYYRYVKKPSRMLNNDDIPELPEQWHHILLAGAIMRNTAYQEKPSGSYAEQYKTGLELVAKEDRSNLDENTQARYESPIANDYVRLPYPPDADYGRWR